MKNKLWLFVCILSFVLCTNVFGQGDSKISVLYNEILTEENKKEDEYIKRVQFIALLMKYMGYDENLYDSYFEDVNQEDWSYKYVSNAQHLKIAFGTPNRFYPERQITVKEAIVFLSRAYKLEPFFDDANKGDYSKNYIKYAVLKGVYPKKDGKYLSEDDKLTKDLVFELIYKFDNIKEEKKIVLYNGYPRITNTGNEEKIGIVFKSNKAVKVYYKLVDADDTAFNVPQLEEINNYLTTVMTDREITAQINVEKNKKYNIYLKFVDYSTEIMQISVLNDVTSIPFKKGDGTKENPYRIYNEKDLKSINKFPDSSFLICNDIVCEGQWEALCSEDNKEFSGVLDGGGYSVKGVNVRLGNYLGFFGVIDGGTVKNLNIYADVLGGNYLGTIAGELRSGTIENCHSTGFVKATENIAGGIVGKNCGNIKNCVSGVYAVKSASYAGGIAGINFGRIEDCISAVSSVYAQMYASSVSGLNNGGTIKNSVGACIEAVDTLTDNSGRITTNKDGGKCINNYAYDNMLSGVNVNLGKDAQDGADVSWKELGDKEFYKDNLGFKFESLWVISKDFYLPLIKRVKKPNIQKGITPYSLLGISNEEELKNISNNLNGHYYLENDIIIYSDDWEPIGSTKNGEDFENGFRGTLDGRGHYIKNLTIKNDKNKKQYGLFGVLYGANIRNLKLEDADISGNTYVGGICSVNYGVITSCDVDGRINGSNSENETLVGGICAINYTNVLDCNNYCQMNINANSTTIGGIAGQNEGFIYYCMFEGKIKVKPLRHTSNSIVGGICGINYSGMVYNCYAGKDIRISTSTAYCGGICGILIGGEIYKCSAFGKLMVMPEKFDVLYAYNGGICSMVTSGIIMNCFSQNEIITKGTTAYTGGICGYGENSSIQNSYSISSVNQNTKSFSSYAGGIMGYNDNGNISGCVAFNPIIFTNSYCAKLCAYSHNGYVQNNYSFNKMDIKGEKSENALSANEVELNILSDYKFYTKSIESGGVLGWVTNTDNENVWTVSNNKKYPLPVLDDVKNQTVFYMPSQLK